MTKAFAVEWGQYNVQVNCILAGLLRDRIDHSLCARILSALPSSKAAFPADIGVFPATSTGTVIFLASAASDHVTGVNLRVDGGYLAG